MLIASAFCGFTVYETIARLSGVGVISFVLLAAIASLWVLEMLVVRFGYRSYRARLLRSRQSGTIPVAIIGAGAAGVQLLDEIQHNPSSRYTVQCFFDDDEGKVNKRIRNVPVSGTISQALSRMRAMDIHEAIFAIPSMDEFHRKEILRQLTDRSIRVSTLPSTLELIDRKPIRQQLREVRIEDLLGRDAIQLDISAVAGLLSGRTVLVTGGGGCAARSSSTVPSGWSSSIFTRTTPTTSSRSCCTSTAEICPSAWRSAPSGIPGGWSCCLIPTSPT